MTKRRSLPRPALAAMTVAAIAAGVVVAGAATSDGRSEPVPLTSGPGGFPVVSQEAANALEASDLLEKAPWLNQADGSPPLGEVEALPSLVFSAGTTYTAAITDLYSAVKRDGSLPSNGRLGPPLPKDIVFARSSTQSALSLTAPFGYDIGTGNVLPPSLYYPPSMTDEEIKSAWTEALSTGQPIPAGASVVGNPLDPCQIIINEEPGPACN